MDQSVLDYKHPEDNGEPDWAIDPNERFQFDPNFDEFGDYVNRSLSIQDILDDTPQISPTHNLLVNKHAFHRTLIDHDKLRPCFGWVNSDIVKQTIDQGFIWHSTRYFHHGVYTFYQPVFYATHDQHFPSESEE